MNLPEIRGVVGLDGPAGTGPEGADGGGDEIGLDQAAASVASFGPGIGMVDVEGVEAMIGQGSQEGLAGVGSDDADVFEPPAGHAVGGEGGVFVGPLDAEIVAFGVGAGLLEQEPALATTHFEFEWSGSIEEVSRVERSVKSLGGHSNLRDVGHGGSVEAGGRKINIGRIGGAACRGDQTKTVAPEGTPYNNSSPKDGSRNGYGNNASST